MSASESNTAGIRRLQRLGIKKEQVRPLKKYLSAAEPLPLRELLLRTASKQSSAGRRPQRKCEREKPQMKAQRGPRNASASAHAPAWMKRRSERKPPFLPCHPM